MPASRYCLAEFRYPSLLPFTHPPPWMANTTGVGVSDLAWKRSSTWRGWDPYATSALVGVTPAGFGFGSCLAGAFGSVWANAVKPTTHSRAGRRRVMGTPVGTRPGV